MSEKKIRTFQIYYDIWVEIEAENEPQALDLYEQYVREVLWDDLEELNGKRLGCWCITTDQLTPIQCHGQVLMRLFNEKFGVLK